MQKHYFSFSKTNYLIILAGVLFVIIGFLLMTGGGSDNPQEFNEAELFSARRITFAPILIILGYIIVIVGIMKKTAPENLPQTNTSAKPKGSNVLDRE